MNRILTLSVVLVFAFLFAQSDAFGQMRGGEPGWESRVIKRGVERTISRNTPIQMRPYRPLHFYGNTIRRRYYRGNAMPMPRDILRTGIELIR
jgi:hypothetical protein